jgi:hypothetical protein
MSEPSGPDGIDWTWAIGQRLDGVCDRFEAAVKVGEPVLLEDFLEGWQEPERSDYELLEVTRSRNQAATDVAR